MEHTYFDQERKGGSCFSTSLGNSHFVMTSWHQKKKNVWCKIWSRCKEKIWRLLYFHHEHKQVLHHKCHGENKILRRAFLFSPWKLDNPFLLHHEKTMKSTDLSETERQKTPGSLYHIQQKQITSLSYMVLMVVFFVFSIHRSNLLLVNMVQGARIFLSFCFW